ncbi:MAG: hypothetical protein QOH59_380 [Gemmatimonadales bacterium]|nr:hypothetical protein [Gemmatimonadales bacterium]
MPRFRKKPVVIEATQWWPGTAVDGVLDLTQAQNITRDGQPMQAGAYVETLEGPMKVSPGDWIITDVAGEKYPCKDEIFRQTYDLVEE